MRIRSPEKAPPGRDSAKATADYKRAVALSAANARNFEHLFHRILWRKHIPSGGAPIHTQSEVTTTRGAGSPASVL